LRAEAQYLDWSPRRASRDTSGKSQARPKELYTVAARSRRAGRSMLVMGLKE
jgi:hypothetical protein